METIVTGLMRFFTLKHIQENALQLSDCNMNYLLPDFFKTPPLFRNCCGKLSLLVKEEVKSHKVIDQYSTMPQIRTDCALLSKITVDLRK